MSGLQNYKLLTFTKMKHKQNSLASFNVMEGLIKWPLTENFRPRGHFEGDIPVSFKEALAPVVQSLLKTDVQKDTTPPIHEIGIVILSKIKIVHETTKQSCRSIFLINKMQRSTTVQ